MFHFLVMAKLLWLTPVQTVSLLYAGCYVLTEPIGPDTVAVKWVCPR